MNARPRFGLLALTQLAVLLYSTFIATPQVQANSSVNVDISIFHDALAPYGNWVNHRTYGQVWYPRNVARNWRPYTDGYWAHTLDYGWLWVSYEPWGWAPFHYGRWTWDNWYGWVWVPGRTWAPAWVFWRSGGGYAAWAPMPPNVVWQPGIGLNISYFNYDRDLSWDSWVAVREYDLPHRYLSKRICPPSQNRQIINVTNYTNNVTLINNTIVNQGVPVQQIEAITRKPVVSVVPKVHDRADINTAGYNDGQPNIIRLPMAPTTPEEIQHNEELARRLDGKNADGTRTDLPLVANSGQPGNQGPRVPGRLEGAPAPVQSPYANPELPNPALTESDRQTPQLPAMPETPLLGISPDSDTQNKTLEAGRNQEELIPAQPFDQQSSATRQPIAPVQLQSHGVSVPVPVVDQQSVLTDPAPMPPSQNELQPLESAKQQDGQPIQDPIADQRQLERQQSEPVDINLQRQQQIDQLQEELARRQDKQKQQETEMQPQQAQRAQEEAQQMQQQEAARQQEMQNQQQMEIQQQQAQRAQEEAQQMQQQQAARQQEMQNQQQMEIQQQQAQHAQEQAQQMQQQEAARQQEMQNQQQMEIQQQQAQHAQEQAQQMQQQEAARQQEIQNQQQMERRRQKTERESEESKQMQKQQESTPQ